jgi:CO/xanthine dehydrogenase FAD-binding subunit
MKAAPFAYRRAASLEEVCALLDEGDGDRMIIAGGQTLVPLMAMRMVRPSLLVDINDVAELAGIGASDGAVAIRAGTRQAAALTSPIVRERAPLLAKALPFVGHVQTRNRGTVGGSMALADPSAEIPLVAVALEATITLRSRRGVRAIGVADFLHSPMTTAREANECLTEVAFPVWNDAGRIGARFVEVSERSGDFAIVAAAAQLLLDESGVCRRAAVAVGGAGPVPARIAAAERTLVGRRPDESAAREAAAHTGSVIDPTDDGHATAAYRRRVAPVLVERAIRAAAAEAKAQ